MFVRIACLLASLLFPATPTDPYEALRQNAEASYAEKSFAAAHQQYEEAAKLKLSDEQRRWVAFRLSDTQWRADAGRSVQANEAFNTLQEIVRKNANDRVWAEAVESVADYQSFYYGSPGNYQPALEWWANSDEIPLARTRYLQIVFRMSAPHRWGNGVENTQAVPRNIVLDALTIATSANDVAHLRYILAMQLLNERRPETIERGLELLDLVIRERKATEWYDDALMAYADQLANYGDVVMVEGEPATKHDYAKALELYRRITNELKSGETRYYNEAAQAIRRIVESSLGLNLSTNFLPDSEQELMMSWRNVTAIEITIAKIDLTNDLAPPEAHGPLASMMRKDARTTIRRWSMTPPDNGQYAPGLDRLRITPKLEPGAYLVTATGGGQTSSVVVLVSDINIVAHTSGTRSDVYVSDVLTGAPVPNARVRLWRDNRDVNATTDANGLARIDLPGTGNRNVLITAAAGSRQAYLTTYSYYWNPPADENQQWRIYAFTDRPAYRPGETVHWKIIARTRKGDEPWRTPAKQTLGYAFINPRGEQMTGATATLNEFGSFWADLPMTAEMPLGDYQIQFRSGDRQVGAAPLFMLEEYKLPEFIVSVSTPKQYRLGDTVEAIIEARYYFGGPVANATVEVRVDRESYSPWPWWSGDDAWFSQPRMPNYGGQEQNILKQTLRTDAEGRAVVKFETPRDGTDSVYTIDACATDASRREVCSTESINVMRQSYRVNARPQHAIGTPGEKLSVDFKAIDSKDQPVKTSGKVRVVRKQWEQPNPIPRPAIIRPGEYREEEILTTSVSTNERGEATFTFTPQRDGYYVIFWTSEDRRPDQPLRARDIVKTETSVWVTRHSTTDLGYHAGGLELIIDREPLRAGERAPLIVATENSGRWVLLTISAAEIIETQLLHLDGTIKLVDLGVDQRHVPDFMITASSVFERTLRSQQKTVKVPPIDRALTVEVKSDREDYRPRQSGTLTVTTRDYTGKPVSAEVALSLSDESVTAIGADPAGDPRPFFYGESRVRPLQVVAGVQMQRFARLVVGEDGRVIDESQVGAKNAKDELSKLPVNRMLARSDVLPPPPPPAPAPQRGAVAESITVTAQAAPMVEVSAAMAGTLGGQVREENQGIEVIVRSDFRSTAFWKPDVVTDANGTATVKVEYPEALTEWRATARAATIDSRFGMATSTSRTNQPLIVRLQAPRFFVAGDRAVVSAVINNNTDAPMRVAPSLEAKGVTVTSESAKPLDVPPHGEARADWTISADTTGTATLRVSGRGASDSDAMEKTFTVYEHGIDKLVARSGKVRGGDALIQLDLPHARRDTSLVVNVSPSLAVAMLDALPYLIEYPYGCTEQTMSRFLPAAIVARTVAKEKLARPAWMSRLDDVTRKSVLRLYDFQHGDGGWGWWKDDTSQSFMTAYVVWGFAVAKEGEIGIHDEVVDRGVQWLDERLVQEEHDPNMQAWMLHALAAWRRVHDQPANDLERKAFDRAYAGREKLSAYSRALLALAAHDFRDTERAHVLVRNLENGVKIDRSPDRSVLVGNAGTPSAAETMATAHWGADRFWWHWYEGPVESTSFALQALVAIDPQNKLIEPVMNWLVKNRRGSRWNNTRDTAIALLALTDYLRVSGESSSDVAYEVSVNGKVIGAKSEAGKFVIDPQLVRDANEITIRRTRGRGPLYFSAEGRFVSLEEPVTAAGHELFVKRDYLRLVPKPTLLKGVVYDKVPMRDGESIASGDRIEVVITVETKNDYEYLLFEDLKPAGLEAVSLNSGSIEAVDQEGNDAYVYQELRDRKVAMFASKLEQGTWTIRYQLRAETPGAFHALPVLGEAMYVPEIRANGDESHVTVTER